MKVLILLAVLFTFAFGQQCRTTLLAKLGETCSTPQNPGNNTALCVPSLTCDPITAKCKQPAKLNDACQNDAQCFSNVFPLNTTSLRCINNKCDYLRHEGLTCSQNNQCRTGICTGGRCVGRLLGAACTSNECADFNVTQLYCAPTNNCTAKGSLNDVCANDDQCISGLACVGGKCQLGVPVIGAPCNPQDVQCRYRGFPTGLLCYPNGRCNVPSLGGVNANCTAGAQCGPAYGCLAGKCAAASSVICNATATGGLACGSGVCDCASGKCKDTRMLAYQSACTRQLLNLTSCLFTACPGAITNINPFDFTQNCAVRCLTRATTYLCCQAAVLPSAFPYVKPAALPPFTCPGAPQPQPTGTPRPVPTPRPAPTPRPVPTGPRVAPTQRVSSSSRAFSSIVVVFVGLLVFFF